MPPNDINPVRRAAQHHAFANLVRTDGWRLYMGFLLEEQGHLEQGKYSAEHAEHTRSQMLGRLYQIDHEIKWVYQQAGEENPLKVERQALLERLTGMLYKPMPETQAQEAKPSEPGIPRRSRRIYAGGVE